MGRHRPTAPLDERIEHRGHHSRIDAEGGGRRRHPVTAALDPERIGGADQFGAAMHQRPGGAAEERLRQEHLRARAHRRQLGGTARGQAAHHRQAHAAEQGDEAILHRIRQRAGDQQLRLVAARHQRQQGLQGLVFPLGEGGLDAAARVIEHPHATAELLAQPLGRPGEIKLDHLTGAGAHQKQGADLGAPLQQVAHQPVELVVGVGEAGQIALAQDRRAEARFGEDHHPGGALDQVGAGAGAHHQEEGIRHTPVQPDD